jgi:hypothetical protein
VVQLPAFVNSAIWNATGAENILTVRVAVSFSKNALNTRPGAADVDA